MLDLLHKMIYNKCMRIAFSGHRDRIAASTTLEDVYKNYPDAIWVHGGAAGFDAQVEAFAKSHGIKTEVIQPDYKTHGKSAPLMRNHTILRKSELLVACYDGRKSGGTYYTINLARKMELPIRFAGVQE